MLKKFFLLIQSSLGECLGLVTLFSCFDLRSKSVEAIVARGRRSNCLQKTAGAAAAAARNKGLRASALLEAVGVTRINFEERSIYDDVVL